MKARVKSSDEIIEVKSWRGASDVIYSTPDMNMFYADNELEIITDTPEEVIYGWMARNKDGLINLFDREPERICDCAWAYYPGHSLGFPLPRESFPEVTWESEPKRVRITITPMEE